MEKIRSRQEEIRGLFRIGDVVKVLRSDGTVDERWVVAGIGDKNILVKKYLNELEAEREKKRSINKMEQKIRELEGRGSVMSFKDMAKVESLRKKIVAIRTAEMTSIKKEVSIEQLRAINAR